MTLPTLVGTLICACVLVADGVGAASSQSGRSCPGIPTPPACGANSNPAPIFSGMGGNRMAVASCADALIHAIASLYSYDDPGCHPANSSLAGGTRNLKFVEGATNSLPPNYRRDVSLESNFSGTLYCDTASNILILAFKGSGSLTPLLDRNGRDDWFYTNFLQHIGERPRQYQFAEDAADLIEQRWSLGAFDGACGSGCPTFVLAGHSKGGGQAQYAAVKIKLGAVVFNSDMVNPVIFSEWMLTPQAGSLTRLAQSIVGCRTGRFDHDSNVYSAYFALGRVKDVRMVNDPLTEVLFSMCGNNLPHAPIHWLVNTLSCSNNGHAIETVFRELQACTGPAQPPT
jgi:hypothetical protein